MTLFSRCVKVKPRFYIPNNLLFPGFALKTTIVIPTYNEEKNLPILVEKLFSLSLPDLSILVVDDNSPDGTGEIAEELGKKFNGRVQVLHRAGKMGLGTAYIQGFKQALLNGAEAIGQPWMPIFPIRPVKIVELVQTLKVVIWHWDHAMYQVENWMNAGPSGERRYPDSVIFTLEQF